ncbi:uncharacterized protein LOC119555996 [Drosophila subpulchrella]|uniref:uncharacterized protein LOC119555996 n=1 Tax=Drosophila subpulchrella TaxID=1486046 RepID=UPI0018A19C19|nr:uncharacterized protein LOC119555996 [Drosophila subpulchrella]
MSEYISRLQSVILVQNLPDCNSHELEELCKPFGEVLGTMLMGNRGLVQFVCEDQVKDAIKALNKSSFKSNVLAVRNASYRKLEESVYVPPTKKQRVQEDMEVEEEVQSEGEHRELEEDMEIG